MSGPTRARDQLPVLRNVVRPAPHARPKRLSPVFGPITLPGESDRPMRTHSSSVLAFPRTVDYACSLQGFKRSHGPDFWVAVAALGCAALWAWLG